MNLDAKLNQKENMKLITLKNGVRMVLVPRIGLKTVTIEWFVKIGSKYESSQEAGLSHFLEHMAFKGTTKRPSAKHINNEIDSIGASYNAGTGHELTSYYIKTTQENIKWAIDILSDILFDSKYDETEIKKEKNVIIEEIKMYQDNPMMGLSGDFMKFLYGKSQIGCWDISGSIADVNKYEKDNLIDYKDKHWGANNMVLVIVGNIGNEKKLIKMANDLIGNRQIEIVENDKEIDIVWNNEHNLIKKRKDIDQAHIAVGVKAYSSVNKNRYISRLIEIMLAGNSSSRLYQTIREERGLSYYIHSISDSFKECGYIGVQTGVPQDKANEAMELIKKEMMEFSENVTEKDLELAKKYLDGKTKLIMDKTDFWAQWVGSKLLLENTLVDPEKELKKYRLVTLTKIKIISKELFQKDNFYTLLVTK